MIVVPGERPPNFEKILRAFPGASGPGVIFAYGDKIYSPSGGVILRALLDHEAVHGRRQMGCPESWWEAYIGDHKFRYDEELYAHAAEFRAQAHGLDRNRKAKLLQSTAQRLIAPLYNYQPPRTLSVALRDLRQELGL